MISVLLIIVLIVTVLYNILQPNKKYEHLKDLTLRKGYYPIIGHTVMLMEKDLFKLCNFIYSNKMPCVIWLGPKPVYFTDDVDEIKTVLKSPISLNKFWVFDFLKEVFGNNSLILANADKWKINRKILSKAFHQNILDSFVYIFYEKSNTLIEILSEQNADFNLFAVFESYTMDSFLVANTGVDENIQTRERCELVELLFMGQKLSMERVFTPYLWIDFIRRLLGKQQQLEYCTGSTSAFLKEVIKKRKMERDNTHDYSNNKIKPLVDIMLDFQVEENFDESYIIDEIRTFFYAAVETSGNTLTFTCTLLGMHPEIQQTCYEEVLNVVGKDKPIEFSDLPNLKYIERVLSESLRILPVGPYIGRLTSAPLDLGKIVIPEDTNIFIPLLWLHRNPKYYSDPLKFDPDRFLPEEVAKRNPYTYIPFSSGPRNCIGAKYGMMLMKTALANIVRNFKIESNYKSVSEIELCAQIVLTVEGNIDCRFTARH